MKGAKELADWLRGLQGFDSIEEGKWKEAAAHLDAKDAIDSAVPGEVGEIQRAHAIAEASPRCQDLRTPEETTYSAAFAVVHKNRATLLAIVQRQAGDTQAALNLARAYEQERDAARAEVERLRKELGR